MGAGNQGSVAGPLRKTTGALGVSPEFRERWPIVLAAFIGLLFSSGTFVVYAFSAFTPALAAEFGWGPLQIATALGLFNLASVIASPVMGRMVDVHGGRRVVIVSTAGLAASFAALALLPNKLPVFYAMFIALALIGTGTTSPAYASIIVGWFDRSRGLALGLAMAGVGVGGAVLPSVIQLIISQLGWRAAYAILGLSVAVIGLPTLILLLRSPPRPLRHATEASTSAPAMMWTALRQRAGWTIALFAFLAGVMLIGVLGHLVPILMDKGLSAVRAAHFQAGFGLAVIAGRCFIGPLMDRLFAPRVALAVFSIATLGLAVLATSENAASLMLAIVTLGLALGAEIDVLGYLISRYFPPAVFGTVYGCVFALFTLGAAVGSVANGAIATRFGYVEVSASMAAIGAATCLVTLLMPPYTRRATHEAEALAMERGKC